jgi:hypothetical protein
MDANSCLKKLLSSAWQFTPVISALRKLKQEDLEDKVSLGYITSLRSAWNT